MYRTINTSKKVPNWESTPIQTWTDGYGFISAIKDDNCILFVLHSSGNPLKWIPEEVITTFRFGYLAQHRNEIIDSIIKEVHLA